MSELKLLKAGQVGSGILIEHDGFASPKDPRNINFINELKNLDKGQPIITEPLYLYVVLQKYGVLNRNGRIYPEQILKSQAEAYQQLIRESRAIGQLDHPESSIIASDGVSHNIVEMWWENHSLMGKLEIIMSPGYLNLGIISTKGDIVANLLRKNIMIGVSSRGVGTVKEVNGQQIVQNDFEIICWDIVTSPSTPGSWMFKDKKNTQQFVESKTTQKPLLINSLDKFLL